MKASIAVGQYDTGLIAFCSECRANVFPYWIKKNGKPVVAVCPEEHHNKPCVITSKLSFSGKL